MIDRTISHYRILEKLGQSGTGGKSIVPRIRRLTAKLPSTTRSTGLRS